MENEPVLDLNNAEVRTCARVIVAAIALHGILTNLDRVALACGKLGPSGAMLIDPTSEAIRQADALIEGLMTPKAANP